MPPAARGRVDAPAFGAVLALCMAVVAGGCAGGGGEPPVAPMPSIASVSVSGPSVPVQTGVTVTFNAMAVDASSRTVAIGSKPVTWGATPEGILSAFSGTGATVTAVATRAGTATVFAEVDGKTGMTSVTIVAPPPPQPPPTQEVLFAQLSAGAGYTCGITTAGEAYCWGDNTGGRLGDGTTTNRARPVQIAQGLGLVSIQAGSLHTCGLTSSGRAYCWGSGSDGQLGNGARSGVTTPAPVSGDLTFRSLALGALHTCGLTGSAPEPAAVYCWGTNARGELGNASAGTLSTTPVAVATPVRFVGIAAGVSHTCGAIANGPVHCWGENVFGQLGDGTLVSRAEPAPVAATQRHFLVAAGSAHTCALGDDSRVYCWGENFRGQVGDGSTERRLTPVQAGTSAPHLRLSAGPSGEFTCTLLGGSSAHCWGANGDGQLGYPAGPPRATGANVPGLPSIEFVVAGDRHACALTAAGAAYCWGANGRGQLGDGTLTSRHTPARVTR